MVGRRGARALPGGVVGRAAPALHAERVVPRRAVMARVGLVEVCGGACLFPFHYLWTPGLLLGLPLQSPRFS